MITDDELAALAADLESDRIERKSSLASSAKDEVLARRLASAIGLELEPGDVDGGG